MTEPVTVRWTDAQSRSRTTMARVPAGTRLGETVDVRLGPRGRSVAPAPGEAEV
ncbi:hypothetical protein [Streptomyces sp. TRM68416]|uniref:hypothetical protein n=1 Tax=Streptomyces sp. TRM68416 TaxID=2758412 RepID=UPI0016620339|nr:hypothetical protein [Streptomyces sp. TRM68416]MBD0841571.1 hypothetical protein [Streptomyces sp. TRM68416]